jgi:hypothetical protein
VCVAGVALSVVLRRHFMAWHDLTGHACSCEGECGTGQLNSSLYANQRGVRQSCRKCSGIASCQRVTRRLSGLCSCVLLSSVTRYSAVLFVQRRLPEMVPNSIRRHSSCPGADCLQAELRQYALSAANRLGCLTAKRWPKRKQIQCIVYPNATGLLRTLQYCGGVLSEATTKLQRDTGWKHAHR